MTGRAVFLDRDGVINQKAPEGGYVTRWEDFRVLPGVVEGIVQLNRAGFSVIVATNQRCVAKGLITEGDLNQLHQRMVEYFAHEGARIDAIYYCPHEIEPPCPCRKPAPGMLLDAARSHDLDLTASWMIGDSVIDIQAGRNAGCKTVGLVHKEQAGGDVEWKAAAPGGPDIVAFSVIEAVGKILPAGNSSKESKE